MAETGSQARRSRILGQYIIKYSFQFKFSLIILAILGISTFLLWMEANIAINRMIDSGMVPNEDTATQLKIIVTVLGKTSMLITAIAFGIALVLSHYIAGPIYRLEKIFQEMRDGNLGLYARLRKKDAFQETADYLNQALTSLRNKLQKERETTNNALTEAVKYLEQAGQTKESSHIKKIALEVQSNPTFIKTTFPK